MSNRPTQAKNSASQESPKSSQRCLILLAVISSLVFLPFLGSAGMFAPTDSFFIESAREMLETHKFIVPLMNYEPWLDKPSTDFCLIALSLATFGLNEFAGRLVSALSGILECLALFWFSSRILTIRQSFLSALCLISFPLYVVVGRTALSDEPLSLALCVALMSLAIASIKRARLSGFRSGHSSQGSALSAQPYWACLGWIFIGCVPRQIYRGRFQFEAYSRSPGRERHSLAILCVGAYWHRWRIHYQFLFQAESWQGDWNGKSCKTVLVLFAGSFSGHVSMGLYALRFYWLP